MFVGRSLPENPPGESAEWQRWRKNLPLKLPNLRWTMQK